MMKMEGVALVTCVEHSTLLMHALRWVRCKISEGFLGPTWGVGSVGVRGVCGVHDLDKALGSSNNALALALALALAFAIIN